MKRPLFVLVSIALFFAGQAMAQDTENKQREGVFQVDMNMSPQKEKKSFFDSILLEVNTGAAIKQHDYQVLTTDLKLGYQLTRRFYGYALFGGSMALRNKGGVKSYVCGNNLGVGVGFVIPEHDCKNLWELRGSWSHNIGNVDWKQSVYDASVLLTMRKHPSVVWTIGYKHIHSHTISMSDFNLVYGTIGIRF